MTKPSILVVAMMSAFATMSANAQEINIDEKDNADRNHAEQATVVQQTQHLPTVVVTAPFSQKMGTQRITNRQIQRRIKGNGTISELLRDNLNVQFSSERGTGNTAGEISPENVSFHGEKFYNNNWMIDGMSNNDTVNPGANNGEVSQSWDGSVATDLPAGGTQSFWISSDMIDRADVYDSNISAKYGQFTGGVVDARLKDPSKKKHQVASNIA